MNILSEILNAQGGQAVGQLGRKFGIGSGQVENAVAQLLPALTRGVRSNMSSQEGLGALLGALGRGNHARYVDDPLSVDNDEAIAEGNGILGHVLGSKERSREVAGEAASATGLDQGILKKMLPLIASMMMGSLGKQASAGGLLDQISGGDLGGMPSQRGGNADQSQLGGLSQFLDLDGDGSVADDLMGMAKKFF